MADDDRISVTVKLFAFFRENRFKQQERALPSGTTVRDVLLSLDIDPEEVGVTMINSRQCALDQHLVQGDQLAVFPIIGGG